MNRRTLLATAAATLASGCLGGDSAAPEPTVEVPQGGYNPRQLSVEVGTTVTWVNENSTVFPEHTVTSKGIVDGTAEWDFNVELEEEGDEASFTFEGDGLYTYVGTVKGEDCMCGLVEVGDVSSDEPLPCHPAKGGGC